MTELIANAPAILATVLTFVVGWLTLRQRKVEAQYEKDSVQVTSLTTGLREQRDQVAFYVAQLALMREEHGAVALLLRKSEQELEECHKERNVLNQRIDRLTERFEELEEEFLSRTGEAPKRNEDIG